MESTITTFDGNGQPDFLSLINAEVEKVEPAIMAPLSPPENQSILFALPKLPPPPTDMPAEGQHLSTETFTEPTLPTDWLSPKVQDYIRTVSESYGCPQEFVVASCFLTAGIAAGKKVQLVTNPYTNYPCDFICMVGKPSRNKTGPLKEVTSPLREQDKVAFTTYIKEKAAYDLDKRENKNYEGEQPVFHQRVAGDRKSVV